MNIEGKKDGPKWAIRPNKTLCLVFEIITNNSEVS